MRRSRLWPNERGGSVYAGGADVFRLLASVDNRLARAAREEEEEQLQQQEQYEQKEPTTREAFLHLYDAAHLAAFRRGQQQPRLFTVSADQNELELNTEYVKQKVEAAGSKLRETLDRQTLMAQRLQQSRRRKRRRTAVRQNDAVVDKVAKQQMQEEEEEGEEERSDVEETSDDVKEAAGKMRRIILRSGLERFQPPSPDSQHPRALSPTLRKAAAQLSFSRPTLGLPSSPGPTAFRPPFRPPSPTLSEASARPPPSPRLPLSPRLPSSPPPLDEAASPAPAEPESESSTPSEPPSGPLSGAVQQPALARLEEAQKNSAWNVRREPSSYKKRSRIYHALPM